MMPFKYPSLLILAVSVTAFPVYAADINYSGVSGGHWDTVGNWLDGSYPTSNDTALLDKTASLDVASPNDLLAVKIGTQGQGIFHLTFEGQLSAAAVNTVSQVGSGSGNQGFIEQTNGSLTVNALEIGSHSATGIYNLERGTLNVSRRSQSNSIYLGTDDSKTSGGLGTLSIGAGSMTTRGEIYMGSAAGGIGIFEVKGSDSAGIGIGSHSNLDGAWTQNAGSILRVKIDRTSQGVTPIFIDDAEDDGSGGDVFFENGALLDVDFLANFINGGTFTIMEWEGNLTDNGLQFAPSVDTNIWSFDLDTVNKQLTVTAVGDAYTREFVHPGSRHKLSDLERMRDMVAAGVEPWASAFANLEASNQSRLEFTPANADTPLTTLTSTSVLRVEAMIAYHNSLMWNITGDQRYADVAIDILNSYSYITNITGLTPLNIGQSCCHLVEAAEIIKHTYDGWDTADMQRFSDMLVYPGYSNTTEPTGDITFYWKLLNGDPVRAGNQGLFSMRSMLAMGVFLDNDRIYDRALRYMRGATNRADDLAYPTGPPINGDPTATHDYAIQWGQSGRETTIADYGYNEVIANYIWESGQNEESSRDQAHGAVGLININVACEQAWNQGEDLYGHLDNRLLLGWEFLNRYNLSYLTSFPDQTTPWEPTIESGEYLQRLVRTGRRFSLKVNPHIDGNESSFTRGQPNTYPNFEIIMAHYRDRLGITGDAIKWSERGHNYFQATYGPEVLGPASTYSATNWGGLKYHRVSPGDPIQGFTSGNPVFGMHLLPMTIEAENYDHFSLKGQGRTYNDLTVGNSGGAYRLAEEVDLSSASEGGFAISDIDSGEWVTYTVSTPATGNYDIVIRYASIAPGGTIQLSFDGVDLTGAVSVPHGGDASTGASDWQYLIVATDLALNQGVQQLRLNFGGASDAFLLNSLTIDPDAADLVDRTNLTLEVSDVTASTYQDLNLPSNTIDGDLDTRWSANGDGEWIRYDLGEKRFIHLLRIAWLNGDTRVAYFDIEVSDDDTIWTPLATGLESSGTTKALQTVDVTDTLTRYVRIVGYGNSGSSWNSINEVEIWGINPPPPLTPINLIATPSDGEVSLSWTASEGATLYHLKRSTSSGSGYSTITSQEGVSSLDTNVVNGTIYYYIVSSENTFGVSADSAPVSAKPYTPITEDELVGLGAIHTGNTMDLSIPSIPGRIYQLQGRESLTSGLWGNIGEPVIGDGNTITITDPDAADFTEHFYRIMVQP